MSPPCFDPTCECCTAWKALDDVNRAEIESLKRTAEVDRAFYDLTVAQRNAAWQELSLWKTAAL